MNFLSSIITYVRRIIKSPSNASITDQLIIDYINRFWMMDVDARMQVFDLKTKYQFQTVPGVDQYNMPLYNVQSETPGSPTSPDIGMYPVYQGFLGPAYINGIQVSFSTLRESFFNIWPNVTQQLNVVAIGNGGAGPYQLQFPILPNNTVPPNPPFQYILRGHVDITGVISTGSNIDPIFGSTINTAIPSTSIYPAVYFTSTDENGNNIVIQDSGQFLQVTGTNMPNYGLLMAPGTAPFGYSALANGYVNTFAITGITQATQAVLTATTNFIVGQLVTINGVVGMIELNGNTYEVVAVSPTTVTINVNSTGFTAYVSGGTISSILNVINYLTGVATNVFFPTAIPSGVNINAQCNFFQCGLPRAVLFYNNVLTLRSPPDRQYLVELTAYLSPSAFFNTELAIPFGYMAEYIARGAARKILSDTGDIEQFQFYEPLFKEQELLVWKRSQRQWTANRTETIYSQGMGQNQNNYNLLGGSSL